MGDFFNFIKTALNPNPLGTIAKAASDLTGIKEIQRGEEIFNPSLMNYGKQVANKISPEGGKIFDTVTNPGDQLEATYNTASSALKPPDAPPVATAPLTPTPSMPEVAKEMNKASVNTRSLGRGRASTYLANPALLDRPGTFFKSSLGG